MQIIQIIKDRIQGKAGKGQKRSSKWGSFRKEYLKYNNKCAVCGSTKKLELHHKIPFHIAPDLELDPNNVVPLCESKKYGINCHLFCGHSGSYRVFNPNVESEILLYKKKLDDTKKYLEEVSGCYS